MEHHEAIEMMASERYLLDELAPELRDAYEEHFFGCADCADDVRFGALFVDHAKGILAAKPAAIPAAKLAAKAAARPEIKPAKREWFAWLLPVIRPAIMVPVFASLLAIIGYQSLVVVPALELAANEPRVLPTPAILAGETRGGHVVVHADLVAGSTLTLPLPQSASYAALRFELYDAQNKLVWSRDRPSAAATEDTVTVWLPGRIKPGTYTLVMRGVSSAGESVLIQQQPFDLQAKK